jgi:hypothetical protein
MNNSSTYETWSNTFPRAIYVALLGDPTLRMEPVAPVSNLIASKAKGGVDLKWTGSRDNVAGYHVYRAATPNGSFARVTDSLVAGTSFMDSGSTGGSYMVRAVALQTNPSGSYFNPSQGVFASADIGGDPQATNGLLTVQIVGSGTVTPNYDGRPLEIGKPYTITAKAAKGFKFVDWSGSVTNDARKLKFVMSPGLTLTATFEDVKRPTLVIGYPSSRRNITNSVIAATGRAFDNDTLAAVYFNLNNNGWMPASGTTKWTTSNLTLMPGNNTIQAYAMDVNGNFSTTNRVTFNHH